MENDRNHTPQRKSISVIAKVKEKAKKWRLTLKSSSSKKKHFDDVYELENESRGCRQASMKHPRAIPVTPNQGNVPDSPSTKANITKDVEATPLPKPSNIKNVQVSPTPTPKPIPNDDAQANHNSKRHQVVHPIPGSAPVRTSQGSSCNKNLQGVCPGSAPAPIKRTKGTSSRSAKTMSKATASDATHGTLKPEAQTPNSAPARVSLSPTRKSSHCSVSNPREGEVIAPPLPAIATKHDAVEVGITSPSSAPAAVEASSYLPSTSKQLWDKGVSVKEYIMQKIMPGEDEKALSRVISDAISPKKPEEDDATLVDKVREAVSLLLQNQQSSSMPSRSVYHSAQNSTSQFLPVTVSNEVTEAETLERLLQTN